MVGLSRSLVYTLNRESIRRVSSEVGEYALSRLIVDGRELFLTVGSVKARGP